MLCSGGMFINGYLEMAVGLLDESTWFGLVVEFG